MGTKLTGYCENCPYPYEAKLAGLIDQNSGDECPEFGCNLSMALEKTRQAYQLMAERYSEFSIHKFCPIIKGSCAESNCAMWHFTQHCCSLKLHH